MLIVVLEMTSVGIKLLSLRGPAMSHVKMSSTAATQGRFKGKVAVVTASTDG